MSETYENSASKVIAKKKTEEPRTFIRKKKYTNFTFKVLPVGCVFETIAHSALAFVHNRASAEFRNGTIAYVCACVAEKSKTRKNVMPIYEFPISRFFLLRVRSTGCACLCCAWQLKGPIENQEEMCQCQMQENGSGDAPSRRYRSSEIGKGSVISNRALPVSELQKKKQVEHLFPGALLIADNGWILPGPKYSIASVA